MEKYHYHIFSPYRVCPLGGTRLSPAWSGNGISRAYCIYEALLTADGIYVGRFSGAGFKGLV